MDKALKILYEDKVGRQELERFQRSIEHGDSSRVYQDMKKLFDTTMSDIKSYMEKEKNELREGF